MSKKFPKLSFRLSRHFFAVLLVVVGVVFVWRGLWNLMDLYIFPENPLLSNVISILIGVFILYLPDDDIKELL